MEKKSNYCKQFNCTAYRIHVKLLDYWNCREHKIENLPKKLDWTWRINSLNGSAGWNIKSSDDS